MKNQRRIAKKIDEFNAYINNTADYLLEDSPVPPSVGAAAVPAPIKNWQRLGLTAEENDKWQKFRRDWNALYKPYSDKREKRTLVIGEKLRGVQSGFVTFASPLLTMMSGIRTVTDDDAAEFHFSIHRQKPVHPVTPIEGVPVFGMFAIGGGDVKYKVRPKDDTKNNSKLDGTDIEVRFRIMSLDQEDIPKSADDLPNSYISTKAVFLQHCGANTLEKIIYAAVRWVDLSNPARNGQWTNVQHTVIV